MTINALVYVCLLNLDIDPNHKVNISKEEITKDFSSNAPNFAMSSSSVNFQNLIENATIDFTYDPDSNPLIYKVIDDTDLSNNHIAVYKALQTVFLESMTIMYALNTDSSYLSGISIADLNRVRKNIRILADWLGDYESYQFLIEYLRTNELALGYAQNKIDLTLNGLTLREDTN